MNNSRPMHLITQVKLTNDLKDINNQNSLKEKSIIG